MKTTEEYQDSVDLYRYPDFDAINIALEQNVLLNGSNNEGSAGKLKESVW